MSTFEVVNFLLISGGQMSLEIVYMCIWWQNLP